MLFATLLDSFFVTDPVTSRTMLRAMPVMLGVLCILAIAYRYYSAFLAAKVATLDDTRPTPAHQFNDGQNYMPTNRWVLFGHHFAAISGAGPLIGPILAMQYGYAPGLLWLVIGVCLAGAVQDMLVMWGSVRRGGKSLAEMTRAELGPTASIIASVAILLIVIIALAGLAFIIVKALGGEEAKLPAGMTITLPADVRVKPVSQDAQTATYDLPGQCLIRYTRVEKQFPRPEGFRLRIQLDVPEDKPPTTIVTTDKIETITVGAGVVQLVPGSSWGTFTIACTIPIALLVGLWMYRIRPGRTLEASILGGLAILGAVVAGSLIPGSSLEPYFSLTRNGTIVALCAYGFIAAILPVWLLLTPRDYISSFMKIGTLMILVVGVIVANPVLKQPPLNEVFQAGGPTFPGGLFPFVFICIMCGAISGFHSLVSSGTSPKMVDKESDIRPIGYGAMLTEGLVGLVALIAAAAMPPKIYYEINVDVDKAHIYRERLETFYANIGQLPEASDPMHKTAVRDMHQFDLAQIEEAVGGESLRGRTGGAVTLAVSMAMILTDAFSWADDSLMGLMKYWYHFAIMFEALFILTTIDAGTRIARYLFQETMGRIHPKFARPDWIPGALLATTIVTLGWGGLVYTGQIQTIWPMFGIANQLLAVLALAVVSTILVSSGRKRYLWVTFVPMLFVMTTTLSAARIMIRNQWNNIQTETQVTLNAINMGMTVLVVATVMTVVMWCIAKCISGSMRK